MPPLVISCKTWQVPGNPLQIRLPYGILKGAFDVLDEIPTAGKLLAKLMGLLETALMPVAQLLEIVDTIGALIQCVMAIPKAIITLSPQPIFDCIKNLVQKAARLLQKIPPICYAVALADVCYFMVYLLDEIIRIFTRIDELVGGYVTVLNEATLIGDLDLINFANCGMNNLRVSIAPILNVLILVQPILAILMVPLLRIIPTPEMQKASDQAIEAGLYFPQALAAIGAGLLELPGYGGGPAPAAQLPTIPIPKVSPILEGIGIARGALVVAHQVLCTVIGETSTLESTAMPTFQYI